MTAEREGRATSVEIPEPHSARGDEALPGDDEDFSTRAIPLDATGGISRWFRRHKIEVSIFVTVIVLLSVGAYLVMRDPGQSTKRDVVGVGPAPGQQIEPYVAVRKRALEDAAAKGGNRVAVVTFEKRISAADADALGLARPLTLDGLIVGVNSRELEVLPPGSSLDATVAAWIEKQKARYESQGAGADEQLAASPSPTPIADWYQQQKKAAQVAMDRLGSGAVVEGAIVTGSLKDLLVLEQKAGVVLVDIAPEGKRADEVIPVLAGGAGS